MSYADMLEADGFRAYAGDCDLCGELGEEDYDELCPACREKVDAWCDAIASDRMAS